MDIKEVLKKFDFSDKEIDVYLAMLAVGPSVVSDIAKEAGINRSTAYVILDTLSKRDFVSTRERRGVKIYNPISPEELVKKFEDVAKEYSKLVDATKKLVPSLKKSVKPKEADLPKVQIFEGEQGMQSVYEDALTSLETIRTYASASKRSEKDAYYNLLAKKKIKVKLLAPDKHDIQKIKASAGKNSSVLYGLSPEISVYDNKIVFVSAKDKSALIIENKEFAQSLKKAFDTSWQDKKQVEKRFSLGGA